MNKYVDYDAWYQEKMKELGYMLLSHANTIANMTNNEITVLVHETTIYEHLTCMGWEIFINGPRTDFFAIDTDSDIETFYFLYEGPDGEVIEWEVEGEKAFETEFVTLIGKLINQMDQRQANTNGVQV